MNYKGVVEIPRPFRLCMKLAWALVELGGSDVSTLD